MITVNKQGIYSYSPDLRGLIRGNLDMSTVADSLRLKTVMSISEWGGGNFIATASADG